MKIKNASALTLGLILILNLTACGTRPEGNTPPHNNTAETAAQTYSRSEVDPVTNAEDPSEETKKAQEAVLGKALRLYINENAIEVIWENNESVEALIKLAEAAPITIQMSMYGGFEQVGSLGSRLPSNDVQTITSAGDIVLYSSSQIVIFYGSNSWAYTRLGKATDKTAAEMKELLGNGNVTVTISYE